MIGGRAMEYNRRKLPWVLATLGALITLCALFMLQQTPNVLQYCVTPPEAGEDGANLRALVDSERKLRPTLQETFDWSALGGSGTVSVSAQSSYGNVTLVAMGEGWLDVYPRLVIQGRRIGEDELKNGEAVAMVDEGLAFQLYGSGLPEDARIRLAGAEYRVVGTVRHAGDGFGARGVGDATEYDVYVPLLSVASNSAIRLETLTLSAVPETRLGWEEIFLSALGDWSPGGRLIDLPKEAMGKTVVLRLLLLIVGLYAIVWLFRRLTVVAGGWYGGFRQALKGSYLRPLIPRLLGILALTLVTYGALIGLTFLLLSFSMQPVYVFTEWVPKNLVEWSSITRVFWNLTSEAAALTRLGTRELRAVEFWGGLLRWGVIVALLGLALMPKAWRTGKGKGSGWA